MLMRVQHYMRSILIIWLIVISLFAGAQSVPAKVTSSAATARLSSPIAASGNAAAQTETWRRQILTNPVDANAWLNYYTWKERSDANNKTELREIYAASSDKIAGTWQHSLIQFLQSGRRDSASLFTALRLSYSNPALYPYAVQYTIIANDDVLLPLYCKALNEAAPLPPALYEYHLNTLLSAGQNATVYAKGLNDLVPLAVLQQVYGIRKDLQLKYYEGPVNEANAYLCLSLGKEVLQQYPNAEYTGILVKMGNAETALESTEIPEKYNLHYLKNASSLSEAEKLIYKNYLPSFIILYKSYVNQNDKKAQEWKSIIEKLGVLTDSEAVIKNALAK